MAQNRQKETLFLVDYGLVKAYRYKSTGEHIIFRDDKGVTGTVRYSGINIHMGYESSRRDDLESVSYLTLTTI